MVSFCLLVDGYCFYNVYWRKYANRKISWTDRTSARREIGNSFPLLTKELAERPQLGMEKKGLCTNSGNSPGSFRFINSAPRLPTKEKSTEQMLRNKHYEFRTMQKFGLGCDCSDCSGGCVEWEIFYKTFYFHFILFVFQCSNLT